MAVDYMIPTKNIICSSEKYIYSGRATRDGFIVEHHHVLPSQPICRSKAVEIGSFLIIFAEEKE